MTLPRGIPSAPAQPITGPGGIITPAWYQYLLALLDGTGTLDSITNTVGAIVYRGPAVWQGLAPGANGLVLTLVAGLPSWQTVGPASFGSQLANLGLFSPNGAPGIPTFRQVVGADFGTAIANFVLAGPTSGVAANPAFRALVTLDVAGIVNGTSFGSQSANLGFMSPNGSAGNPTFRNIVGADFGTETANFLLAGPTSGGAAVPGFRALVSADLASVAGQIPGTGTNDNAAAGDVGEYIFSSIASGSAVALVTATSKDITSITLTPGDWDVWGSLTTLPAATTTQSDIRGWVNTTSATDPTPPNGGCYAELDTTIGATLTQTLALGMKRIQVATATTATAYLSANVSFATSTLSAYGFIGARRVR